MSELSPQDAATRLTYTMTDEDEARLLGDVLRRRLGLSRRTLTHAKYREDGILLDGVRARTNLVVHAGQVASVSVADDVERESPMVDAWASPEAAAAVSFLYEDEAIAVVNKPANMVMYPGPGHAGDTLGNVMLAHSIATGRTQTLHPVHRLDVGTSGVVLFAYNPHVQHVLQNGMHTQAFLREYVALCEGVPEVGEGGQQDLYVGGGASGELGGSSVAEVAGERCGLDSSGDLNEPGCSGEQNGSGEGAWVGALTCEDDVFTVDAALARVTFGPSTFGAVTPDDSRGKPARTHFTIERVFQVETPEGARTLSLLRLRLETGRTHQIRIHLALTGHPLIGDSVYGGGDFSYMGRDGELCTLGRPALHSARVELTHPMTGEVLKLEAPLPADLEGVITAAIE